MVLLQTVLATSLMFVIDYLIISDGYPFINRQSRTRMHTPSTRSLSKYGKYYTDNRLLKKMANFSENLLRQKILPVEADPHIMNVWWAIYGANEENNTRIKMIVLLQYFVFKKNFSIGIEIDSQVNSTSSDVNPSHNRFDMVELVPYHSSDFSEMKC